LAFFWAEIVLLQSCSLAEEDREIGKKKAGINGTWILIALSPKEKGVAAQST